MKELTLFRPILLHHDKRKKSSYLFKKYKNICSNTCKRYQCYRPLGLYEKRHYQPRPSLLKNLDSLSPIRRFIGQAMSWGKYWARQYVEPNIFPTHGETNKFVYWMKNRIQFYHYYVLRILCPISLYTFLNKQISNKREKKINLLTNYDDTQNYFQFKLPNHGKGTCQKSLKFCNKNNYFHLNRQNQGTSEGFMPFWYDGIIKHWELQEKQGTT